MTVNEAMAGIEAQWTADDRAYKKERRLNHLRRKIAARSYRDRLNETMVKFCAGRVKGGYFGC